MGNEANCAVRVAGRRHEGKALLETAELLFRGPDFRLKIALASIRGLRAEKGELQVKTREGVAVFELGPAAERWREKILHPKSRAEKLGLKPGVRVFAAGAFEPEFRAELREAGAVLRKSAPGAALLFLAAGERSGLARLPALARSMKGAAGLWVIYPKGRREFGERDVLAAGREAGLKDVKVVGFSPSHTALKFVIPVERRASPRRATPGDFARRPPAASG